MASLAPYVAGKTGTTDGENDVWFVGFTNEVTVAVWIGYDNADGKRRTLGGGITGGSLAVPIFESIIQAVWTQFTPRTLLSPPSAEASRLLVATRVGGDIGDDANSNARGSVEYLRRDANGQPRDSRYALVSPDEVYSPRYDDGYNSQPGGFQPWGFPGSDPYRAAPRPPASPGGLFGFFFPRREEAPPYQQPFRQQAPPPWQQQPRRYQDQQQQRRQPPSSYPYYQDRF
jgi:membrane peptidoglycan carboxypeptidase